MLSLPVEVIAAHVALPLGLNNSAPPPLGAINAHVAQVPPAGVSAVGAEHVAYAGLTPSFCAAITLPLAGDIVFELDNVVAASCCIFPVTCTACPHWSAMAGAETSSKGMR